MKKVLFISYLFPPILNSGTYRSMKFVKYLPEYGWEPIVLTVDCPPDRPLEPSLLDDIPKNVKIFRAPMFSWILAQFLGKICPSKWRARFVTGIEWRLRRFWRIPDVHAAWKVPAIRTALKIYKQIPYDIIFATGYPWTSFLVGKEISSRLGKPLILDYRDPWTGGDLWKSTDKKNTFFMSILERINRYLEKQSVKQAKLLIATTENFANHLRKFEKENPNLKVFVITNGYDSSDFKNVVPPFNKEPGKLYIAFVGVWKRGYGPEDLYKALKILKEKRDPFLNKLKVICAGFPPGPAKKFGIAKEVLEMGYIPHKKAISLIKHADILYMFVPKGRFSQFCLPGKLFEYIGAAKPLLISCSSDSCVAKFLENYAFFLRADPHNINQLIRNLKSILENYDYFYKKTLEALPLRQRIERRFLTQQLANIFNSCLL